MRTWVLKRLLLRFFWELKRLLLRFNIYSKWRKFGQRGISCVELSKERFTCYSWLRSSSFLIGRRWKTCSTVSSRWSKIPSARIPVGAGMIFKGKIIHMWFVPLKNIYYINLLIMVHLLIIKQKYMYIILMKKSLNGRRKKFLLELKLSQELDVGIQVQNFHTECERV